MIFAIFKEQDAKIREKLLQKGLEISTGKRYTRISEDVWATYNILSLKEDISRLSQHSKNRLFADMNMSFVDSVLGSIEDILKSLYTKGIQAKNSPIRLILYSQKQMKNSVTITYFREQNLIRSPLMKTSITEVPMKASRCGLRKSS